MLRLVKKFVCKGQIKPKAGLVRRRFSQKTNEHICLFAVKSKKANKTNFFVRLGESMARQSAFGFSCPLEGRNSNLSHCGFPADFHTNVVQSYGR